MTEIEIDKCTKRLGIILAICWLNRMAVTRKYPTNPFVLKIISRSKHQVIVDLKQMYFFQFTGNSFKKGFEEGLGEKFIKVNGNIVENE